jgi:hypothetical protein
MLLSLDKQPRGGGESVRLRALKITNFGCIDDQGYEFDVDKIVVLIGPKEYYIM